MVPDPVDAALRERLALFAEAAHDLRTPLTSLTLWMDTVASLNLRLARSSDAQTVRLLDQALTHMQSLVRRSVHLTDDLLDIVRVEAGHRLPFSPAEIDLVALVREALLDQPTDTGNVLQLDAAVSEIWGSWDADRLLRLLENLLGNATKYSGAGTPITIRLRLDDTADQHWALLEVEDCGIGIPTNELPYVLDPFYRAANVSSSIDGSGLGMWGCRTIVQQHGGRLSVASREGQGTRVTVRLPVNSPACGTD
jgi:signal transduction histidine kinase